MNRFPPFGARVSAVSSYGDVREEQSGESSSSQRDFAGLAVRTFTDKTTSRFPGLERRGAMGPHGLWKGTREDRLYTEAFFSCLVRPRLDGSG